MYYVVWPIESGPRMALGIPSGYCLINALIGRVPPPGIVWHRAHRSLRKVNNRCSRDYEGPPKQNAKRRYVPEEYVVDYLKREEQ